MDPTNDSVRGVQASLNSPPGSIGTLQTVSYLGLLYKELVGISPQASHVNELNTLCMGEGALDRISRVGLIVLTLTYLLFCFTMVTWRILPLRTFRVIFFWSYIGNL